MTGSQYSIEEIAGAVQGKLILGCPDSKVINHLLTDSRKVHAPEASLFFAIPGKRNDGHAYLKDLFEKGTRNFVVSEETMEVKKLNANFIVVPDTLKALQQIALYHRRRFAIPVIAITGSNGKTIVKEWLFQLLRQSRNIVRSPKSYNSQIGVPLSVWLLNKEHDLGVFEAGISQPGEMQNLEQIIHPNIGIFTNIGEAHAENFTSQEEKIREKLRLFDNVETIIYCKDYSAIHQAIQNNECYSSRECFTWSRRTRADLQIGRIARSALETEIQGIYKNDFIRIRIPFSDEASIENAIHCWALMLYLGYNNEVIAQRMEQLSPVAMRLELKEGINKCSIINDSYNSDLGSLTIALDFLNQQQQHAKKTIILSDIYQTGRNEEQLYKEVAELISRKNVDRLIGIGEAISCHENLFSLEKKFFHSTEDFLKSPEASAFKDETILIKGARAFGFERISQLLQQKAHNTVFEINLNAIIHNLNYYRSKVKPGTKTMAMVKAFSYGSGSFEIANVLQFHRVDYLAVAYPDEGVELRNAGITLPIMVMNPEEQGFDLMIQHKLEPEIYSFRTLQLFLEALKRSNSDLNQSYPIHIKLDTGMKRLGFEEQDINELIVRIQNNRYVKIQTVFSHLAGTDEPSLDDFTREQVARFKRMSNQIASHFEYPFMRHIVNSAGILRFQDAHFEMVRLGIGLYGIAPNENEQRNLQQVGVLKTTISQIKNIQKGESIGYNRKWVAKRDMISATVAIGYADGLSRQLSNGKGKMVVNGKLVPIVGNVCMDMCMLDITDVAAREGDQVIVFGEEYSILQHAKDCDTIPYEVLTNVSQRVKRIYYHE